MQVVKVLLEAKSAEVNATDLAGRTAMHFAAAAGSRESIELLRLYGGDVNQLTKDVCAPFCKHVFLSPNMYIFTPVQGKAPLLYSLKRGTSETNAQLILLGAQFSARDRRHMTPWDVKKLYGIVKPEVILDLLKSTGDAGKWEKTTARAAERRAARAGNKGAAQHRTGGAPGSLTGMHAFLSLDCALYNGEKQKKNKQKTKHQNKQTKQANEKTSKNDWGLYKINTINKQI